MQEDTDPRERTREIAAEFIERGDPVGWFEALYRESAGDNEKLPWGDLKPNPFLRAYAEKSGLKGNGRGALVVGCGLGDDAGYLEDLGFKVTAFDISPTAIEWARRLHHDSAIKFLVADLFNPPKEWYQAFEFVLEVYTIQPLPLEIRPSVIDAVSNFVKLHGTLLVVTRGREDNEEPDQLPWPLSQRDLSRFEANSFVKTHFEVMIGDEEPPEPRFVVEYKKV